MSSAKCSASSTSSVATATIWNRSTRPRERGDPELPHVHFGFLCLSWRFVGQLRAYLHCCDQLPIKTLYSCRRQRWPRIRFACRRGCTFSLLAKTLKTSGVYSTHVLGSSRCSWVSWRCSSTVHRCDWWSDLHPRRKRCHRWNRIHGPFCLLLA